MTGPLRQTRYPHRVSRRIVIVAAATLVALAGCGLVAGIKDLSVDGVENPDATTDVAEPFDAGSTAVVPDPPLEAGCVALGPLVPANVTVTGGGIDWSNPEAAKNQDDLATVASPPICCDTVTRVLSVTGFGFEVPAAARIQGIKVLLRAQAAYPGTFNDTLVQLTRIADGGVLGDNLRSPTPYPTTWVTRQYGSATALWGAALTPDVVNSPDFGVSYQSTKGGSIPFNLNQQIDAISMTVFYCQ